MEILNINSWNVFYQKNNSNIVDIRFNVLAGSEKEESEGTYGVAHFVEHLMFKGTEKRGYEEISDEIAEIGGQSNAFTSRTIAAYYIRVIKMNWVAAFEILSDMFFNSIFDEKEIEKERNVILEEAKNNLDDHETFMVEEGIIDTLTPRRGHRIIGSMESIASISRDDIMNFLSKHYQGENVLLSVSGNVDREELIGVLSEYLPEAEKQPKEIFSEKEVYFNNRPLTLNRDKLEQAYSVLLFEGFGREHPLHNVQKVLLNALGGGMHSLLFKKVREEFGLCYNIDAGEMCGFNDASLVCIHANLSKTNVDRVKTLVFEILETIKKNGVNSKLLNISKVDYTSFIAMHTETSTGYVTFYGINYLLNLYRDFDRIYSDIHGVTNDQIIEIANMIFKKPKEVLLV